MVTPEVFKQIVFSFEEAEQQPHFEKESFRINKKIFATLDLKNHVVVVKLADIQQSVFCAFDSNVVYPVKGAWGKQGWTAIALDAVEQDVLKDILTVSYCNVAPKHLAIKYKQE